MPSAAFDTFLSGIAVALAVAVPIGPMAVLCIQQTLAFGLAAGLTIGLAAATVQACYGLVAALGHGRAVMALVGAGASLCFALSAALLFWFAFRVSRAEVTIARGDAKRLGRWRSYREALTFGFANPLTPILFFAAFPALTPSEDLTGAPVLIGGVFAGASGWYVLLSTTVALCRRRFPSRLLTVVNKAAGFVLAGLGLLMLANAFGMR